MADTATQHIRDDNSNNNNNTNNPNSNATAASTPGSDGGGPGGTKVAKDRNCPFCGQAFTSSSLGRHLDLYIKPKNPKPPDGVHDLAEIRKLRGGITRRQPRASLRAAGTSDDGEVTAGGTPKSASLQSGKRTWEQRWSDSGNAMPSPEPQSAREQTAPRYNNVNAPNWQATGVINNLPPRAPSRSNGNTPAPQQQSSQAQRIQDMRRDGAGNRTQRPGEFERDDTRKLQESVETGRAAELALREVLGSLDAARTRTQPKLLFENFDFFSLTFGGLCLAILPQPSTLFSATPFASPDSCTIQPPGKMQLDVLTRLVWERVVQRRNGSHENRHLYSNSDVFKHQTHVQGAWEHWANMGESQRHEAWTIECLRAFSQSQQHVARLQTQLAESEQRVVHLEAEYDRLSKCQLPRENLLGLPQTTFISDPFVRELNKANRPVPRTSNQIPNPSDTTPTSFDPEALLTKWRNIVRTSSRHHQQPHLNNPASTRSHAWNSPIPSASNPPKNRAPAEEIGGAMIMSGSIFNVNGAMPRQGDDAVNPGTDNYQSHGRDYGRRAIGAAARGGNWGGGSGWGNEIVDYQTPVNPGTVVGSVGDPEGEGEEDDLAGGGARKGRGFAGGRGAGENGGNGGGVNVGADEDDDEDAEGEEEDGDGSGPFDEYLGRRNGSAAANANGKRPLSGDMRGRGSKVARER
ncbi:hypothetical protein MBLNU230_g0721t1 [Neophaeotheca triangularis]